jgi:hypothetical protein
MKHIQSISQFNESSKNDYYEKITRSESTREDLQFESIPFTQEENDKLIKLISTTQIKKDSTLSASLFYHNSNKIYEYDFINKETKIGGLLKPDAFGDLPSLINYDTSIFEISKKTDRGKTSREILIHKKEDEWFLVIIFTRGYTESEVRDFSPTTNYLGGKFHLPDRLEKFYYKCDQLEGLFELIKDYLS